LGLLQVLLRDPSDENVIPVVEELRRRLPVGNASHNGGQGDGKEIAGAQNDGDTGDEDGIVPRDSWLFS
jgi:magnesium transporter